MELGILLVDDHVIVRQGLKMLLEREKFTVIAEASEGNEAVRLAARHQPAVAVLDLSMPALNGIDACREIVRVSPATKVIVLTVHTEEEYLWQALGAGAKGYLLKSAAGTALSTAIREVLQGNVYLGPGIAKPLVQAFLAQETERDPLSTRERQVVQLVAEGISSKEVAARLGISTKTAESHRNRIMQKLGIHDVAGLVRYAIRKGIIEP
jgi:two-component system, NarL family, response regulator NreC